MFARATESGGALGSRDRSHERLVAVLQMAVHHVEVALVDRQVDRLADRAARMVQRARHVGELDEVAEILDPRVAAAFVEIADERASRRPARTRCSCRRSPRCAPDCARAG